jgi:hypothetical protein
MAINGQVGNSTNLSDQDGSSVLSFEELGHGAANDYLPGREGRFLITHLVIDSSVASASIQNGLNQSTVLEVEFSLIKPVSNNTNFNMRFFEAGVEESGAVYDRGYWYMVDNNTNVWNHSSNDNQIPLGVGVGNGTYENLNGHVTIYHANESTRQTNFESTTVYMQGGALYNNQTSGELPQASVVDGLKFFFGTGNIASGEIRIYGYG